MPLFLHLYFLYKILAPSSCLSRTANHFQFDTTQFQLMYVQINYRNVLFCLSLLFKHPNGLQQTVPSTFGYPLGSSIWAISHQTHLPQVLTPAIPLPPPCASRTLLFHMWHYTPGPQARWGTQNTEQHEPKGNPSFTPGLSSVLYIHLVKLIIT